MDSFNPVAEATKAGSSPSSSISAAVVFLDMPASIPKMVTVINIVFDYLSYQMLAASATICDVEWIIMFARDDIDWAVGIAVGVSALIGIMFKILDRRIKAKAEEVITPKLEPVIKELRGVTQMLNNGISDKVDAHTVAITEVQAAQTVMLAGQAEMKGRLDTLVQALLET